MTLSGFRELPISHPWTLILVTLILAAAGGYVYLFELQIVSDRKQLISRDIESNRRYLDFIDDFGDNEILILAVCASGNPEPDGLLPVPTASQRKAMKRVARDWAAALRERPDLFPKVYERIIWPKANSPALLYLELDELQALASVLEEKEALLARLTGDPSLASQFSILNELLRKAGALPRATLEQHLPTALQGATAYLEETAKAINHGPTSNDEASSASFDWATLLPARHDPEGFFFSQNGRLLTVYAHVQGQAEQRNRYAEVMQQATRAMKSALASSGAPADLSAGIAGMPALESEELETTQSDFTRAAVLALLCVTLLFVAVFGGLLRPLLGVICLGCAIGMTFGFTWLAVGHLNILAMIFAVILVALGIDFAIHFLTHYEHLLSTGISPEQAVRKTYSAIGGALWMGGLTTSAAFLSACLTDFTGLAELGLIAGSGLLFCLLCMYFTFPAMLMLLDERFIGLRRHIRARVANPAAQKLYASMYHRRTAKTVVIFGAVFASVGFALGHYDIDTNLLRLQAKDSEANLWQKILVKNDDRSLFAISTADNHETLEGLRRQYHQQPNLVRHVDALFPFQEKEKRRILQSLDSTVSTFTVASPGPPAVGKLKRQLWNLRQNLRKMVKASSTAAAHLAPLQERVQTLYSTLNQTEPGKVAAGLAAFERQLVAQMRTALASLSEMSRPDVIAPASLPSVLLDRLQSKSGKLAMFIYPAQDTWQQDNLEHFVNRLREIDAGVMGELVSLHDNGNSVVQSFIGASGYSLMVIILLLLVWTRSLQDSLLALLPLAIGIALLVATMRVWPGQLSWNFTNFFGLPIIIGIGVDSGIHLVRAWRSGVADIFDGAVKAVVLSSLTTIIGFGILATSTHLGVRSMGTVLFIGILGVLLSALTILPATLYLLTKGNDDVI